MAISLYDLSVANYLQTLGAVVRFLGKRDYMGKMRLKG